MQIAQAQLQLALFGMDEKFMNSTNQSIRQVFNGTYPDPDKHFGSQMVLDMLKKVGENNAFATATDIDVINGTKDVFGPLSKAVVNASKDLNMNLYDQYGEIKNYKNITEIINEFYDMRLELYVKRKLFLINKFENDISIYRGY